MEMLRELVEFASVEMRGGIGNQQRIREIPERYGTNGLKKIRPERIVSLLPEQETDGNENGAGQENHDFAL